MKRTRRKKHTTAERLEMHSVPEPNSGCVLWTGALSHHGYGKMRMNGTTTQAHRVAYEAAKGPIPEGLHLDHLCRVRCCINPGHLEPVTAAENNYRSAVARGGSRTHCLRGHLYDASNTCVRRDGRSRCCRACACLLKKQHRARAALTA